MSSIFNETDISLNVSICENEGGPSENIVQPDFPVQGRRVLPIHSTKRLI